MTSSKSSYAVVKAGAIPCCVVVEKMELNVQSRVNTVKDAASTDPSAKRVTRKTIVFNCF